METRIKVLSVFRVSTHCYFTYESSILQKELVFFVLQILFKVSRRCDRLIPDDVSHELCVCIKRK